MKAICIGHSTYDTTLPLNNFPIENTKTRVEEHIECGGGPASNGGYLLAKWGIDTTIASVIGDDYYGDRIIDDFLKIKANTKYLEKKKNHQTSSSYIIANKSNGSRTIITSKKEPIRKLSQKIEEKYDLVLVDGEHPETAIEVLKNNQDAITILDAGRLNDDTKEIGKLVKYLVSSKEFAEEFSKTTLSVKDPEKLITAHKKMEDYFKTNIIITLEAKGSFTKINDKYEIIPSIRVKAIDSTGAGDIFHGALAYFLLKGNNLKTAIKYASITGAISVTRVGSRYSIPELREVLDYDNVI